MKIVILGTGFVSQGYQAALSHLGYSPTVLSRASVDYTDRTVLKDLLKGQAATHVLNCAGFTGTSVDVCEFDKSQCFRANVTLALTVAEVCAELKVPLLHVSSGCIFSGKDKVFTEDSDPNPQSFYGEAKAMAEEYMRPLEGQRWIFRPRMPFSHTPHPRNLLTKLINYPQILEGNNSITWLDEFCIRSWQIMEKAAPGIYNATQPGPVSTMKIAQMLKDKGLRGEVKQLDAVAFYKNHVRRSECVLDVTKFEAAYKSPSTPGLSAVTWCVDNYVRDK